MLSKSQVEALKNAGRVVAPAVSGDEDLGPLALLPGVWKSLPGRGWNLIALPFATAPSPINYRLLMNQYNEDLRFTVVDKAVPNRGIRTEDDGTTSQTDQFLVTLDYEQRIAQIAAADQPPSGQAGGPGAPIHHEPGLWLHMTNETTGDLDIARLATVPHGDAVLALGTSEVHSGPPVIPALDGRPIGVDQNIDHPYLAPYKHFHDSPFENLFDPLAANALLRAANAGINIVRTTKLEVDTKNVANGGIRNIPFVTRQADASEMVSTFWIQELVPWIRDYFKNCCPISS